MESSANHEQSGNPFAFNFLDAVMHEEGQNEGLEESMVLAQQL